MVDTNVFIQSERLRTPLNLSAWHNSELVCISTMTVSEILIGVHRAGTDERKLNCSAFVEAILSRVVILDFTVYVARLHAEIFTDLSQKGHMIGAHDLIIAATARFHGMPLLTANVQEFSRVRGLNVIPFARE